MELDYFTYNIAEHWVSAIENGDYSSLDDHETALLDDFIGTLPRNALGWQWSDEGCFALDEISGLMAQCLEAKLYINGGIR